MSLARPPLAVFVAPSLHSGAGPQRIEAQITMQLAEGLRREGWTLDIRRSHRIWSQLGLLGGRVRTAELVVTVLGGHQGRTLLTEGAVAARWAHAPMVVVDDSTRSMGTLRRSGSTRLLTDGVVSRCVDRPPHGPARFDPTLLEAIGSAPQMATADGIGPLVLRDLDAVVRVHRSAFPNSAMTLLGPRVVERYYRWQFVGDHPHPFAEGAWRQGELVGFVFGGVRHDAVTGFIRRFLPDIARGALTHPAGMRQLTGPKVVPVLRLFLQRGLRGLRPGAPAVVPSRPNASPVGHSFGILSIAVAPEAQGSSAAAALMVRAEAEAVALDLHEMELTVNVDNARAIRFYERLGWRRVVDGEGWKGRMTRDL